MSEHRFTCPSCGASHDRGCHGFPGSRIYRCLHCGYTGDGSIHPDPEVDALIRQEIAESQAWNMAHGLPAGPAIA